MIVAIHAELIVMDVSDSDTAPLTMMISLVSTCLGYIMVLASFLIIFPQIWRVSREGRVDGLSLTSQVFDLLAGMMGFTMAWSLAQPFSVFGELVPVLLNISVLCHLIIRYRHGHTAATTFSLASLILFLTLLFTKPFNILWYLNLPVALSALLGKIQQVYTIHKSQDSGVLSLETQFLGTLGSKKINFLAYDFFKEAV